MSRIGLIVPSSNTIMEPDFMRRLPPGVTMHTARMHLRETNAQEEARMLDDYLPQAVSDLQTIEPDVVVFGCTSAGALRGAAAEEAMVRWISQSCGCPVVSVMSSVKRAFVKAGWKTAVLVTPYVDELTQRVKESVLDIGVRVIAAYGLGLVMNTDIGRVSPGRIVEFAVKSVGEARPDAVFISCTNFQALDAAVEINRRLGLPVITSNGAALQESLAILGIH